MDKKALAKAESRLELARESVAALADCRTHADFSKRWYVFLIAAKNVYTALEQGAKVSAQSRQWFGAKKQERRGDELLQYLFQARDDDEHGLGPVTERVPSKLIIGKNIPGGGKGMFINYDNATGGGSAISLSGEAPHVEFQPAYIRLIAVIGRGPVTYPPPTMHKGQPIADTSPAGVATLAIGYLSELIAEARLRAA